MPSSWAARTTRRNASTPRRCPSARGNPREAAQRPLPSMMMATCNGPSDRSCCSAAGTAFDIGRSSYREDFFFLGRQQLIDFGDRSVGRLLHVGSQALLIIFRNFVILLELFHGIEAVATDMADRDLGGLGVFVRDLHKLLAALLVQL